MKRFLLGIFLITCFVAPLVTTIVLYNHHLKQVRKEVKWKLITGIQREELVLLKLNQEEQISQCKWKHTKEFEFKGEMYDIVESQIFNDTTYYWCWKDSKETKLNKQLNKMVVKELEHDTEKKESQNRLYKFFDSLYFLSQCETDFYSFEVHERTEYIFKPNYYRFLFQSSLFAPPDLI